MIIDNYLCTDLENAALRGVDVRIKVPDIPDKKIVFHTTRSFYYRLLDAEVKIYEYEPGFLGLFFESNKNLTKYKQNSNKT